MMLRPRAPSHFIFVGSWWTAFLTGGEIGPPLSCRQEGALMQERIAAGLPILVAETDPLIALDLEGRLREAGYTVVGPLYSPHELDKLAALPLAGAVLNSGALGPDVAASLKPLTKSGVPVLLISGYSDIDRHIGGEGVTVLSKPVDLHEIMEALREAVSRRIAKAHDYTSSADDPRAP